MSFFDNMEHLTGHMTGKYSTYSSTAMDMYEAGGYMAYPSQGCSAGLCASDSYLGYAAYSTEREEIINRIVQTARETGETSFTVTGNNFDYNQDDIDYIVSEVHRRLGY